jgi:hypothetical protein
MVHTRVWLDYRIVPKLYVVSKRSHKRSGVGLPKRLLDASYIVFPPVSLRDLFLSNRDTAPSNSHDSNIVDIILIKADLESGKVSFWPLVQSPALNDLCGFNKLQVFTGYIASEEFILSTLFSTFKQLRCCTGEGCDALGIREGLVELSRWSTELFCIGNGGGVDRRDLGTMGASRCRSRWAGTGNMRLRCSVATHWA